MNDRVKTLLGRLEAEGDGELGGDVRHEGLDVSIHIEGDPAAGAGPALLERATDLGALAAAARAALAKDHADDEESIVGIYREHHAEELEADELEACFGGDDAWRTDIVRFLEHCALTGVAVRLEDSDASLMVDLQLGGEMTDYVLCVTWDPEGRVLEVDMES